MDLHTDVRSVDSVSIVEVSGDVDVWTAESLRGALQRAQALGNPHTVVDLSNVPFVDSTGIGVLVGALKRTKEAGGSLHLVVVSPGIHKVLAITRLDQVFILHESRDEALDAIGQESTSQPDVR
ncbi:MAG: STAS domain-containing protein [Actinomycetes bacterium]